MNTVNLKGQEWATENYNAITFRNGDEIPFAKTPEDFKELTSSKKPCGSGNCSFDFTYSDED